MRRLRVALAVLALGLLAGCEDGIPNDGREHLVWVVPTDVYRPMIEGLVRDFERENPKIAIDMRWTPGGQYPTKLKTLIAAGKSPDIINCGDVWVEYLKPFLSDLTDLGTRDAREIALDDLYPAVRESCEPKGRLYYLPRTFNVSLLYYNRTLFDARKEPYPTADWTWDDYVASAKRLTVRGSDGKVQTWGSNIVTGWWGEWLTIIHQEGGDFFGPHGRCVLDTPAAIRGLTLYRDKITTLGISPPPGYGPPTGFASGKLAMDYTGHTGLWPTYAKLPDLDWDIEALPKGPSGRRGGEVSVDAIGVAKATPHREAAWRFVKFMASPYSIRQHIKNGFLSVRRSLTGEMKLQRPHNLRAVETALASAESNPRTTDFLEIALDLVQPEIDRMLTDGVPPEVAAKRATAAANTFLDAAGTR